MGFSSGDQFTAALTLLLEWLLILTSSLGPNLLQNGSIKQKAAVEGEALTAGCHQRTRVRESWCAEEVAGKKVQLYEFH